MGLKLRKFLYLVLSAGGIAAALFAALGFLASIVAVLSTGEWRALPLGIACAGAVVAMSAGLAAIQKLPVRDPCEKRRYTWRIALGGTPVVALAAAILWDGPFDRVELKVLGVFVILPVLVGLAVLVEMWWTAR